MSNRPRAIARRLARRTSTLAAAAAGPRQSRAVMEHLERRELFAATAVNADKHRPPLVMFSWGKEPGFSVVTASHATSAQGEPIVSVDGLVPDAAGNLSMLTHHAEYPDRDSNAAIYVAAGDVDGDGLNDIVVKLFSVTGQPTPVGEAFDSNIAILVGDGKGGMQFRGSFTQSHVLESTGNSGKPKKQVVVQPHVLDTSGIAVGDVNGDGKADLIDWAGDDLAMLVSFPSGPRQTVSQRKGWDGTIKGSPKIVGTGDVNGDGRADLIAFDEKGQAVLFSQFQLDPKDPESAGFRLDGRIDTLNSKLDGKIERVIVGDLNGDGRPDDLALVAKESVSVGLGFSRRGGTEVQSSSWNTTQLGKKIDSDDIFVGDLNGDGKADVVDVTLELRGHRYIGTVTIVK